MTAEYAASRVSLVTEDTLIENGPAGGSCRTIQPEGFPESYSPSSVAVAASLPRNSRESIAERPKGYSTLYERFMQAFDMFNPSDISSPACLETRPASMLTEQRLDEERQVEEAETQELFYHRRRSSVTSAEAASLPSVIGPAEASLIAMAHQSQFSIGTSGGSTRSDPVLLATALRRVNTHQSLRNAFRVVEDVPQPTNLEAPAAPPTEEDNPVIPVDTGPNGPGNSSPPLEVKPQRSLSRVIEQAELAFPAIKRREPLENDELFLDFCIGVTKMIAASLAGGIPGILFVMLVLFKGAQSILSENLTTFNDTSRYTPPSHAYNNVTTDAIVAYEDLWSLQFGGFFSEFPEMDENYYLLLFGVSMLLLLFKVACPLILYGTMYKRCQVRALLGMLLIYPIGLIVSILNWSEWVATYQNKSGTYTNFYKEDIGVLVVAALAWPYMAITKPKLHWSWPKFHGAIPVVLLPLMMYLIAPHFARNILMLVWTTVSRSDSDQKMTKVVVAGFINLLLITGFMLPIQCVSVIVWNYNGFLQQSTLLVVIFPLALFFHFANFFNILMSDDLLSMMLTIVLHVLLSRILRSTLSPRIYGFCCATNALTSICGTFPRMKMFNEDVMQAVASVEFRSQLMVQDMGIQYIATISASAAAFCLGASSAITTVPRGDRIMVCAVTQIFADVMLDVMWVGILSRSSFFAQPLIGGWVRRHAKYTASIALSSLFAFTYICIELSRTMCLVRVKKMSPGDVDVYAYVTTYCSKS